MKRLLVVAFWMFVVLASTLGQVCQENEQRPCRYPLIGECRPGVQVCEQGQWGVCLGGVGPSDEICNDGKDNDCDDAVDEGCVCQTGAVRPCGPEQEVGVCRFGRSTCLNDVWGVCEGAVFGYPNDLCGTSGTGNGLDDNCDGQIDDGCTASLNETGSDCFNGVKDGNEVGIDCGGSCRRCATCDDVIQNQNETGVDCGGPCRPCESCGDGIQNQGELEIDCGGPCAPCVSLEDTDVDSDGLIYSVELMKGTNPDDRDTDGDGVDDKKDTLPLCPNTACDEAYGETAKSCRKDCGTDSNVATIVIIVLIIVLFFAALFFYRRMSRTSSQKKGIGATVMPKIDVDKYSALERDMSKDKRSAVEDKLEKSLKKAEGFLKR